VLESGLSLPVAYYYGNRGDRWIEAKITLFSEEKYQVSVNVLMLLSIEAFAPRSAMQQ